MKIPRYRGVQEQDLVDAFFHKTGNFWRSATGVCRHTIYHIHSARPASRVFWKITIPPLSALEPLDGLRHSPQFFPRQGLAGSGFVAAVDFPAFFQLFVHPV